MLLCYKIEWAISTNISANQSNFHKQSLKVVYSVRNAKSLTRKDSFVVKMFDRNALAYIIQQKTHKMQFYLSVVLLIRRKSKTWTWCDALKLVMPVVDAFMLQDIVSDRNKTNISANQSNLPSSHSRWFILLGMTKALLAMIHLWSKCLTEMH